MTTVIFQGDQYYIPFRIKRNGVVVTPDNMDEVKISFGGHIQKHPGELTFDGFENWLYHLSADVSRSLSGQAPVQVQTVKDGVVQHSSKTFVDVDGSLFGEGD
jgi:hypothetical protein